LQRWSRIQGRLAWSSNFKDRVDIHQDTYIFPLRDTVFEGAPAKIPFAYKEVLEAEYHKKALTLTDYEEYVIALSIPSTC